MSLSHLQPAPPALALTHKNTEHSFSGCPGDTNYRVWEGSWDDAGERRSGTPCDEQGLSYTHTPLPGVCVFMSNLHRFHRDTCACLPRYDNYYEEIALHMCAHGIACVHIQMFAPCVCGHLLRVIVFECLRAIKTAFMST